MGMALSAKGKYNDALEHYRKALELDPKYTEVHNTMGATFWRWENGRMPSGSSTWS